MNTRFKDFLFISLYIALMCVVVLVILWEHEHSFNEDQKILYDCVKDTTNYAACSRAVNG